MLPYAIVSALLILTAGGLILLHVRSWRIAQARHPSGAEREFAWTQCRRRTQTSGLVGLVGGLMLIVPWITDPRWFTAFIIAMIAPVFWIMLLAAADVVATQAHFASMARDEVIQKAHLEGQLRQAQRQDGARRNGHGVAD